MSDNEASGDESDDTSEADDPEPINNIPVMVGFRPSPISQATRTPVRTTILRNNKLVDALSTPKLSLFNVISAFLADPAKPGAALQTPP